ncbi:hypothetical protein N5923_08910 [Erwiniaceae bacterium BAC15a-03b]|uniref:Uncharacterized protein n=1 Tax=Winslowiella arboricola TaxID=2978220 RepID=A0A9J6PJR6_9GAMM|nr:hypothetical protein [Winslowiella arboricola]MCU5771719.1 hypothetical protein [Winslowiella arboricola]MCU5777610.1 hypothetical protein [Winslowiella arboricola]
MHKISFRWLAGMVFCSFLFSFNATAMAQSVENKQSEKAAQTDEDIAVLAVHKAIRDNKLSSLRDHCLAYDFDDSSDKQYFIIDVREDKRYAVCGGDPETSVHLFRFKMDRKNHTLLTDAGAADGTFHAITQ